MHYAAVKYVNIQFQKLYSSSDEKASFSLKHYVECEKNEKREENEQKKTNLINSSPLCFLSEFHDA